MIHYTKAYIKDLLDKYMDGTSTLEEEDILAKYFRGKDVPQEWEDYLQLFQEIEAMKPKTSKRWIGWSVAAAIVTGILYVAIPSAQTEQQPSTPLVKADTATTQPSERLVADSMPKYEEKALPIQTKKRRLRKAEPTIHDIDKAYSLMAEAEEAQREADQQIAQYQQEIIEAQLAAYGFIPVKQEDGTIIYINEQSEYIAYEE